ncbi:MAG: hypothetical protein KA118_03850 [Verrucomicrobia bacterium]|nr:hypothetical protein [Verrucomicrobiota bacterium]
MTVRAKSLLVGWILILSSGVLWAQTNTNSFQVTIEPPDQFILVEETTNLFTLTIGNLLTTNLVVEDPEEEGGEPITNEVVTANFSNLTLRATLGGRDLDFNDGGNPPDLTADDATFSAEFIAPEVAIQTNLTLLITIIGDDLTYTNESNQQEITTLTNRFTNSYVLLSRPDNDRFTNAFKVVPYGALILHTNNYASIENREPKHAEAEAIDASVWWKWSIPVTTNVLIDTAGSSFEPILGVYTGLALTNLASVASSTGEDLYKAYVHFTATAGVTYRIAIAGQSSNDVGDIRLRIEPGAVPDTNGPGVTILSPLDNDLFTTNLVEFSGQGDELLPKESGLERVMLQINETPAVPATGTTNWTVTLDLPPGTNTINAFGVDYAGNTGAVHSIIVKFINPTNDTFGSPITLPGPAGLDLAINGRAGKDPGEPNHGGNEGGHSIWYKWIAPEDGMLFVTTTNSSFDTLLAVYTGDSVSNLTLVAENDDVTPGISHSEVSLYVKSGETYYIAVDGYGGAFGDIQLAYDFVGQPLPGAYLLNIVPAEGGTVTPPSGNYLADTNLVLTAFPDPNYVFIRWSGSVSSTNNPLDLLLNSDKTIIPVFAFDNYTETFESGNLLTLPWSTSGNVPWSVQKGETAGGQFAARSGAIADGQQSRLLLQLRSVAGNAFFHFRVSSEDGWDWLEFHLNGKRVKRWSGEAAWQKFVFLVPAGVNTLEWRYVKDPTHSDGLDAAFIDNLYLPLPAQVPLLSLSLSPAGGAVVQLEGSPFQSYIIQSSTDLSAWQSVSTNSSPTGAIQWADPEPLTSIRYYRAYAP